MIELSEMYLFTIIILVLGLVINAIINQQCSVCTQGYTDTATPAPITTNSI